MSHDVEELTIKILRGLKERCIFNGGIGQGAKVLMFYVNIYMAYMHIVVRQSREKMVVKKNKIHAICTTINGGLKEQREFFKSALIFCEKSHKVLL